MKKLNFIFLSIALILICKIEANATNLSLGISCPKTAYSGTTIKCTITSNVSGGTLTGINANYSFSNASFQSFSSSNSWDDLAKGSSNGFVVGNTSGNSGGTIGTLSVLINASTGSTASISLTNIEGTDTAFELFSASNVSTTVSVIEKPIPTTTTAKKVLYLNELSVEGYDIGFNKSTFNYTIDVGYEVSTLKVSATANNNYTVAGTGTLHINEGENSLLVTVTDSSGEKSTYTIKVNRVVKVSNIVNNNVEAIENAFKSNKELIINLDKTKDDLKVTREILDIIKGLDRKLIYNIQSNNDTLYTYIFDGNKFNDSYNNIDLNINLDNTKKETINKILNDKKMIYFENKYNGFYPMGTKLKIKNTTGYHQETIMRLYKLNAEDTLELIKNNIKITDKFMEFEIEKGAKYILSNKNTNSKNTNIILIIISIIIFIEILIVGYLILRKKKQVKVPKINEYLDNPDFIDENENIEKLNI